MTRLSIEKAYRDCPFCGAKDIADSEGGPMSLTFDNRIEKWSVDCEACGAEGPKTQEANAAVHKWNERAVTTEQH